MTVGARSALFLPYRDLALIVVDEAHEMIAQQGSSDVEHLHEAYIAHINEALAGKPEGMAVIECPYLLDLIEHNEFDTIYHQHLCYYSATALDALFRRNGLFLNDVKRLAIHGGSLRLFVGRTEAVGPAVKEMLASERAAGVTSLAYYESFADKVRLLRERLTGILSGLKAEGRRIVGYGAAAKANTLMYRPAPSSPAP